MLFYVAPISRRRRRSRRLPSCRSAPTPTFFGLLDRPIHLAAADVNVGLLVIFAITSMGVYGIVLAGWSSNSKYSLLGGLRSSAQMISYELSYGLSFAAVIMLAGSLSLGEIVESAVRLLVRVHSEVVSVPAAARLLHFLIAGVAETNRAPFDFPKPSRSWSPATTPSTAR